MAKTKTPFFSTGAHGTIADTLTSQKRGSDTLLRQKPTPTDPYSLAQAYQRWLYEDYAHLWTLQTAATQAAYRAGGSRHHLTGFQYWMKYHLANLPDLAGYWKLDRTTGALAKDSSLNQNSGTIIGATPTPGSIGYAYSFDGLNDNIRFPFISAYDLQTLTILLRIQTPSVFQTDLPWSYKPLVARNDAPLSKLVFQVSLVSILAGVTPQNIISIILGDPANGTTEYVGYYNLNLSPNTQYDLAITFSAGALIFYLNGIPHALINQFGAVPASLYSTDVDMTMCCNLANGVTRLFTKVTADFLLLHNRVLDQESLLRWASRSYE